MTLTETTTNGTLPLTPDHCQWTEPEHGILSEQRCSNPVEFWVYTAYEHSPGRPMESYPLVAHYPAPTMMVCADHVGSVCTMNDKLPDTLSVVRRPPDLETPT